MINPQPTRNNRYDEALNYLDKLFSYIPGVSYFSVIYVVNSSPFAKEAEGFTGEITFLLLNKFNYANDINRDRKLLTLNSTGIEAKKAGGHFKYKEEKLRIRKLQVDQVQSVIDTNKSVIITNRIQRNVLWLTIGISALTLFITFYSACKDKPIIVVPSKVIIQQIPINQDRMKQQIQHQRITDSLHPPVHTSKK